MGLHAGARKAPGVSGRPESRQAASEPHSGLGHENRPPDRGNPPLHTHETERPSWPFSVELAR